LLTIHDLQSDRLGPASPATVSLLPECNAIASSDPPSDSHLPASLGEKALLTYQAMSNSDNIVLLLERGDGAAASGAVIIGANQAFRRASGYSSEQLVGRPAVDLFITGNDAETLMTAISSTGSLRSELTCSRADGTTFMLGMNLMPAPARTPGKVCSVILGRDVTASLQARQMQDSIQRLLAKVFSSVDAAVAIVNAAGRIVMTNPHIDLLLGYKPNGLVGRSSLELVAADTRPSVMATLKQQMADGHDVVYATSMLRADGSWLPVRITSVIALAGDTRKFRIITLRPDTLGTLSTHSENAGYISESVGHIKLVGLDEVRTTLGDRWPAAAERAMATAEAVIKRHLGPQDSHSRADDTSFLICFGKLSEEEASFRAAMIGREIRNRLIGQGENPDTAYVRSIAARVRMPGAGEPEGSRHATLLDGLDQQLERLEHEARQTLRDALVSAACDLERVFGRNPAQTVASQVLIPHELQRRLACALAALPHKESSAFDLDGLLIGLAAQHAITSMARGDTTPLLVRIGFEVFAARAATERFFAMLGKIDPRVTGRLIILLSSLPEGLPRTRLQDCVNRLRPFCRGVGYQVDEVAALPQIDLSNSFNPIVVLPMPACITITPAKLRELFASLQSRRAKVLIRSVGSEKDAVALRSLGADMISMARSAA
jgi:PAS domain S-box-containing protein